MISENKFKEINDSCDIVELVSGYVELKKAGANYNGLCPFHNEKTPSFYVSPEKNIATCMGCKKGGSPITFLSQIENISKIEAAKRLADKYHIEFNYDIKPKINQEYRNLFEITDFSLKFYKLYLNNSKLGLEALDYLHKRGLSNETINKFDIGLAPNNRGVLYEALKEKGFNEVDMLESGLIKKQNSYYDLFTNRIMFPIKDEDNNVLGYSGRAFNSSDTSKYVNSPESKLFKKGEILFNLNNATKDIRRKNRCILVEGQMDVISLDNAGITEALCSMGTALTINQAKLIKKYTNNVILAYDGDSAGQNAIIKAIDILKLANLNIMIVKIPDGLDPDEYLKKYGSDALNELFNQTMDEYDFRYYYSFKDRNLNNLSHVELIKTDIFKIIKSSKSETLKEKLLRRLSTEIYVSYDALLNDYSKYNTIARTEKTVEKERPIKIESKLPNSYEKAIANLIVLSMDNKESFNYIKEDIGTLSPYDYKIIILDVINMYYEKNQDKNSVSKEEFIEFLKNKFENYLKVYESLNPDRLTDKTNKAKLIVDSLNKYKEIPKKLEYDENIKTILNKSTNEDEKIQKFNEVTKCKKSMSKKGLEKSN